jgi:hypothetical protein
MCLRREAPTPSTSNSVAHSRQTAIFVDSTNCQSLPFFSTFVHGIPKLVKSLGKELVTQISIVSQVCRQKGEEGSP